nr:flagellin [Maricaulis parjimensis]
MSAVNSALQHMTMLEKQRVDIQARIVTGLEVSTASDNGAIWALAQGMRASNAGREEALTSIDLVTGVVSTALAAAEGISDLMVEMKEKMVAATDTTLDETGWRTLMNDFVTLGNQAQRLVENASFNDLNLLEAGASDISAIVSGDPSAQMTIAAEDLSDGGGIFDSQLGFTLPATDASGLANRPDTTMVQAFEDSMSAVNSAVSRLGVSLKSLEIQRTLLIKQIDETTAGIGNLIDADLGREGARLEAMMVREELGMQALQIANQRPRTILQFFS